jgi:hypothetical protein
MRQIRSALMSRADALESDLFESLRSRSILVRHGVSAHDYLILRTSALYVKQGLINGPLEHLGQMHSFTRTHFEMLKSLYPECEGDKLQHIWNLISGFLEDECTLVQAKIQAQRSGMLVPLLDSAVGSSNRVRRCWAVVSQV